jgi:signal transduction histidine kinase
MYSKLENKRLHSAAWRISLWATLAFAFGTTIVFAGLHRFVANDIQRRSDAWLSGEVEVLGDVAERTPKDRLYDRVVGEVAELASKEVPNKSHDEHEDGDENDSVFFLQAGPTGPAKLWVGAGNGKANLAAIRASNVAPDVPFHLNVNGFPIPFRVVGSRIGDGSFIYLALSERDELRVLRSLRMRFRSLGLLIVLFGFGIVFYTTRRMLGHVREITEAASRIGESDLSRRVPTTAHNDEIGQLSLTLNRMLDRIESSVHQLHTITDSLAHDLRSPLTAIRGKLEMSLSEWGSSTAGEPMIVTAIDELDRLTEFLNTSLDVAEARADALRLTRSEIDLDEMMRVMIELYEPCMSERGLRMQLRSGGQAKVFADAALIHRVVANLLDNELKHLPASCTVMIILQAEKDVSILTLEDDGPGFAAEVEHTMFKQRVKSSVSSGHGLGLAFVEAVARAHGGSVTASNRAEGGARLVITLPRASQLSAQPDHTVAAMAG